MIDDLTELERQLTGMPLRRPSAGLDARVASGLPGRRQGHWRLWVVAGTAAAAAVAVLVIDGNPRREPSRGPIASPRPSAVWVERDVSRTVDDGVIGVADRIPYRRVHRQTVRQIWWADPATGARLWAELPSDRMAVEPAETF